jgi:hypothetical protein
MSVRTVWGLGAGGGGVVGARCRCAARRAATPAERRGDAAAAAGPDARRPARRRIVVPVHPALSRRVPPADRGSKRPTWQQTVAARHPPRRDATSMADTKRGYDYGAPPARGSRGAGLRPRRVRARTPACRRAPRAARRAQSPAAPGPAHMRTFPRARRRGARAAAGRAGQPAAVGQGQKAQGEWRAADGSRAGS